MPDIGLYPPVTMRIPYEVLSEIFLIFLEDLQRPSPCSVSNCIHRTITPTTTPLLRVGAVSVAWRRVAWTTPRLWTSVSFAIKDESTKTHATLLQLVKEWIHRAGRVLPLSINAICYTNSETSLEPFLNLLKEHRHRWQKLDFECDHPSILERLLRNNNNTCPSHLNQFRCITTHPSQAEEHAGDVVLDLTADSPREIHSSVPLSCIQTRWQFLRRLCITARLPIDHLMRVLYDAPALTRCTVCLDFIEDIYGEVPPLVHNQLESLDLGFIPYPEDDGSEQTVILEELLSRLSLPSLTTLCITFDEDLNVNFDAAYADMLVSFLSQSRCLLKTFEQCGVIFLDEEAEDQLLAVLMNIASLERLRITTDYRDLSTSFTDHFLGCLSVQHGNPDLLPNLKYFTYNGPLGFSEEVLAQISYDGTAILSNSLHGNTQRPR